MEGGLVSCRGNDLHRQGLRQAGQLFIYSSPEGTLDVPDLAIVNNAAVNIGLHVCFELVIWDS